MVVSDIEIMVDDRLSIFEEIELFEDTPQEEMANICSSVLMIPVGFFIGDITPVSTAIFTGILSIDGLTAVLYILGLYLLFLTLFCIVFVLRSG